MAPEPTRGPWFLFHHGRLLLDRDLEPPRWTIPEAHAAVGGAAEQAHALSEGSEAPAYAVELPPEAPAPTGLEPAALRDVLAVKDTRFFHAASRASQIVTWASTHRFCGRCGKPTDRAAGQLSMTCPSCGLEAFPRVSPAVIVAVLRGEEILLARARRFPTGMYSVLAGFVEAGESLEACVHREIREEVGIEVRDLVYFGSQSWPFPHSLMVAFIARHARGEITADPSEIVDAGWYGRDRLPDLPLSVSIARSMIEWYRSGGVTGGAGWPTGSS